MRNPWEDTIIVTLRDLQWIDEVDKSRGPTIHIPPAFVKLDSTAEQTLGDLLLQQGSRFYIFEVKSSEAKISREWLGRPKKVFNTLASFMKEMKGRPSEGSEFESVLWTSLTCHQLVYWSEEIFDPADFYGTILAQPYLMACRRGNAPGFEDHPLLDRFQLGERLSVRGRSCLLHHSIPLSALRRQKGFVAESIDNENERVSVEEMGVPVDLFLAYLDFLITWADGGNGSMNAVVCSDGGLVKRIQSYGELERFLVRAQDARKGLSRKEQPANKLVEREERVFMKRGPAIRNVFPKRSTEPQPGSTKTPTPRGRRP